MATENTKPSMEWKFATSQGKSYETPPSTTQTWEPTYYFAYGTLMDPEQARLVLRRKEKPRMFQATLEGWTIKMWGQYPALIDEIGKKIHGVAFMVNTKQEEDFLKHYETQRYVSRLCWINIENKGEHIARTFLWDGCLDELKDGTFDLKDWQLKKLDKP